MNNGIWWTYLYYQQQNPDCMILQIKVYAGIYHYLVPDNELLSQAGGP